MSINLQALQSIQPTTYINNLNKSEESSTSTQFADHFKQALNQLNNAQIDTEIKTELLVNGDIEQLHDVMIAAQKSSLSMSLAVEVQSKVIEAYNEIMRMQV